MPEQQSPEEMIFPRPRRAVIYREPAGTTTTFVLDTSLDAEHFSVRGTTEAVVVRHADAAARRYAEAVLNQLRVPSAGAIPCCEIDDGPDLPARGFMLDVTRGRVPTRATLTRFVELLALARYNHLQLYVEHAFAYAGHEKVWAHASPLTGDDLAWLDALCRDAGIELAANQASFGHFARWLAHEPYRKRAECPDGWEPAPGHPAPPTVLAPDASNAQFVLELIREQMAHLTTDVVNIGCDEVFELGRGGSRDRVARHGLGQVFAEHVNAIAEPLLAEGRRVLAWADMPSKNPVARSALNRRITSLVWSYDAPGQLPPRLTPRQQAFARIFDFDTSVPRSFAELVEPFVDDGRDFWVSPGTSTWNSFVGRFDNARDNILDAAVAGRRAGAGGILVTDWGDSGHLQPPSVSFLPLLYGGAVAWCAQANHDIDLRPVLDRAVFDDSTRSLGRAVELLAASAGHARIPALGTSPLFAAVFPDQLALVEADPDTAAVPDALDAVEQALAALGRAQPGCLDGEAVLAELTTAAELTRLGAQRLLGHDAPSSAQSADLVERVRQDWLRRSRPGGLDDSLALVRQGLGAQRAGAGA